MKTTDPDRCACRSEEPVQKPTTSMPAIYPAFSKAWMGRPSAPNISPEVRKLSRKLFLMGCRICGKGIWEQRESTMSPISVCYMLYIYIYIYTHSCIHIYIYIYTYLYMYTCICMYHMSMCIYIMSLRDMSAMYRNTQPNPTMFTLELALCSQLSANGCSSPTDEPPSNIYIYLFIYLYLYLYITCMYIKCISYIYICMYCACVYVYIIYISHQRGWPQLMDEASLILSFVHKMDVFMYICLEIHDIYIDLSTQKHTFMY